MSKYNKKQAVTALLRVYSLEGNPVHRDVYDLLEEYIGVQTKSFDRNGVIRKTNTLIDGIDLHEFCKDYPEYKVVVCTALNEFGVSLTTSTTEQGTAEISKSDDLSNFTYQSNKFLQKNQGKRS